jgi:hypothetical protein
VGSNYFWPRILFRGSEFLFRLYFLKLQILCAYACQSLKKMNKIAHANYYTTVNVFNLIRVVMHQTISTREDPG